MGHVQANRQPRRSLQEGPDRGDPRPGRRPGTERDLQRRSVRAWRANACACRRSAAAWRGTRSCWRAAPPMPWHCATRHHDAATACALRPGRARWRESFTRPWKPPAARRWARATCRARLATSTPDRARRPTSKGYGQITAARRCAAGGRRRLSRAPALPPGRALPSGRSTSLDLWRPFIEEQAGGALDPCERRSGRPGGLCPPCRAR